MRSAKEVLEQSYGVGLGNCRVTFTRRWRTIDAREIMQLGVAATVPAMAIGVHWLTSYFTPGTKIEQVWILR